MSKVLAFGTFDLLHEGHLDFFKQAKAYGDELVVVIALDATVEDVKGRLPDWDELRRKKEVEAVEEVDKVIFGNKGDKYDVIKEVNPDVIVLGYDQLTFTHDLEDFIKKFNPKIRIVRMKAHNPEKYKTSKMRRFK